MLSSLEPTHSLSLYPTAPFHFDATFFKPDHFPSPDNTWQPGVRWQTMRWDGVPLGLKFENIGQPLQPELGLTLYSAEPLGKMSFNRLVQEIRYRYISPWEQKIYSKLFFDKDPGEPLPVPELIAFLTSRYTGFRAIAVHYFWEDLFWQWKNGQAKWLDPLIRL